jgi:hypothetical protein
MNGFGNTEQRVEIRMTYKGWILIGVALVAGCGTHKPPKAITHSYCKLSPQSVQTICLNAAKEKNLIPHQNKPDEQPDPAVFRFNYSVQMPNGEIAAVVSCEIDAAHNAVVDAQLLQASATSEAADYMHEQGLCSEWKSESELRRF